MTGSDAFCDARGGNVGGQEDLLQLVYVSAATVPFDDQELERLLERARSNNEALGITGVLLFESQTFFQVLEGEPTRVAGLYERIEQDTRHANVLRLAEQTVHVRNFGQWSMGFIRDRARLEQLPGFIDFFGAGATSFIDLEGDARRMKQILDGFRRGRWRRSTEESLTSPV